MAKDHEPRVRAHVYVCVTDMAGVWFLWESRYGQGSWTLYMCGGQQTWPGIVSPVCSGK